MNAKKVTLGFIPETITAMQDAALLTGLNEADTVNRAVQFWALVQLVKTNGGKVYVRESEAGPLSEVRFGDEQ